MFHHLPFGKSANLRLAIHRGAACFFSKKSFILYPFLFLIPFPAIADSLPLPVGLQGEFTLVEFIIQTMVILWGIVIIVAGARFPLFTIGSFFLPLGLLTGVILAGNINYLLAIAIALLVFALLMAAYIYLPWLGMAIANAWVPASVYLTYHYFQGAMSLDSPIVLLFLIAAGVIVGAIFYRVALCLLTSALGTLILSIIFLEDIEFLPVLLIFTIALLWQIFIVSRAIDRVGEDKTNSPKDTKTKNFLQTLKLGSVSLLFLFIILAILTPQPDASASPNVQRFSKLAQSGAIEKPGFVLDAENSYYLFGKAYMLSLAASERSFWNRFRVLFLGKSPGKAINRMRAVKDERELEKMRRAAEITSRAFEEIAPLIRPGINEADIEKEILRVFRENGANGLAFKSIVASGANAVLPHYDKNNAIMSKGLVVIDIGCSVDYYASDMTRTFPVKGEYNAAERELMEIVNAAADSARAHLKAGASLRDLDRRARAVIDSAGFGKYFVHFLSHHVGLNVHDPQVDFLQANMVITIEPGIYIPAGAEVDSAYWDLGVRIEDSYIVTEEGYEEITWFPKIP